MSRAWIVLACLAAGTAATAADIAAGPTVSFLACPVARDTGPDTDLCFFAEYAGHRYALANPPDWGSPQLKHRVLVEGRVKEGALVCGATPIEGRASVITEVDLSCNTLVPFDDVIKGVAGGVFNSGSPQQRAYAQDLARRAALDPKLSVTPAILDPPVAPSAVAPFDSRSLVITYPYNSDRGSGPDMIKLKDLALYAQTARASTVTIVGYRADSQLSDGGALHESPALAQARAAKIAGIVAALGIGMKIIHVSWQTDALPGTGTDDWRNRKVEVTVTP